MSTPYYIIKIIFCPHSFAVQPEQLQQEESFTHPSKVEAQPEGVQVRILGRCKDPQPLDPQEPRVQDVQEQDTGQVKTLGPGL